MGPCHCIAGLMSGLRLLAKFSLARHVDPWGMKPHAMPCHAWVRNQSLVTQIVVRHTGLARAHRLGP